MGTGYWKGLGKNYNKPLSQSPITNHQPRRQYKYSSGQDINLSLGSGDAKEDSVTARKAVLAFGQLSKSEGIILAVKIQCS